MAWSRAGVSCTVAIVLAVAFVALVTLAPFSLPIVAPQLLHDVKDQLYADPPRPTPQRAPGPKLAYVQYATDMDHLCHAVRPSLYLSCARTDARARR